MWKHERALPLHFAIILTALTVSDRLTAEETLGRFPLCEASSALLVTCPGGDGECLLVGDNEQAKELYLFPVRDQKLNSDAQRAFDLHLGDGKEVSDIEALAGISGDEILVFASHSRNTSCEVKPKRRQFGKVSLSKAQTAVVDTLGSKKVTCEHLFGNRALDAPMKAACEAIDNADAKATLIDDAVKAGKLTKDAAKAPCNAVNAYNAEGAVAIHTPKGTGVWIGLRAPLLPAHPSQPEKKHLAILLHMKDLTAYTFDRVAFVDLGGRGVRDLSSDATSIWVIAGPPEDRTEPFELRRIRKSALDETQVIDSELIRALPPSSEGLAISGRTAYVVIDGDTGEDEVCKESARVEILSLP
ncbi:MAG: DUF3616 domain-containing protein [Verrucomicrobiales bacterium]|nr:DUF3616 domain-containing protein [Verrucomicrobiales bacterium]